jgi:hypothetical protein
MFSLGLLKRSLKLAMAFAPTIIVGYLIGLPYGPKGVAFAYSLVMVLWVVPFIKYCVRYTGVSSRDILQVVSRPLLSGIFAGAFALGARLLCYQSVAPLARLIVEGGVLLMTFVGILLFVAGQKSFYFDLLRELKGPAPLQEKGLASA